MKRHLEHESSKLNELFIQNIKRSTESTKKEIKANTQEEVKKVTAEMKTGQEEMKKEVAEVKV
jgi:vacuolar-type H+-ATPase subunit E/Vma4